ncbi:MAG: type II toxin-antitoxin system VapB family antitoxin [Chlamydiae bacterium]|nr:type II toxin-antitoxin system VapB family antitoxin [Chlamydiota bacterium]MBI3278027.1 type II toxin-antitoxin system VapB family antitoxin [Chlamydiota bacterium]
MRTTMDIPRDLLEEAKLLCGTRSKTSAVILSLQKLIQMKKIEKLRALRGRLDLRIDLRQLRRDRTAA